MALVLQECTVNDQANLDEPILEIKGSICEMPMIEIDKNWSATGISCRG